jgi:hypothetical protein
MVKHFILWVMAACFLPDLHAQIQGCTDPQATNFNVNATVNNGSCTYANQNYSPQIINNLPASLNEWSGMVYWDGFFWGHNDGGSGVRTFLYAVDTATATIQKVIKFSGITNVDWEDIAQDSLNFYIGDFGNNANGNRKNLKIYKVPKSYVKAAGDTVLIGADSISVINFAYSDQTNFTATGANKTRYDCESMFFHRDSLHLFTKNWIGNYSVHYTLPAVPGTWLATRQDSLKTDGYLLTGADIGAEDQFVFSAYSNASGACVLYLIYGFDASVYYFNTGNKRQVQLPSSLQIGQLEAICYINGIRGAMGSERFIVSIFDITQNIRRFTTNQWVTDHYMHNVMPVPDAGSMRYNSETNRFEYFDGKDWQVIGQQ